MTAKQLEQETGCKIMVRGRGSMRDKKKVPCLSFSFFSEKKSLSLFFHNFSQLLKLSLFSKRISLESFTNGSITKFSTVTYYFYRKFASVRH